MTVETQIHDQVASEPTSEKKKDPKEFPFQVRLLGSDHSILSGHDDYASADTNAEDRNRRAEGMKIKARYEVIKQPVSNVTDEQAPAA